MMQDLNCECTSSRHDKLLTLHLKIQMQKQQIDQSYLGYPYSRIDPIPSTKCNFAATNHRH